MLSESADTLAILAKEPLPGRAKTRLIPAIGADAAARLSAAFLADLLARLSAGLPESTRILVCYDPPDAEAFFVKQIQHLRRHNEMALLCQSSGDLGARLAAVRAAVAGPLGYMGTDAPDLPLAEISRAQAAARAGRAYLQRTADGGYALLALPPHATPDVFKAIEWSTAETARQQCERIRKCGIELEESSNVWWDVDEPADLLPLRQRLECNPHVAPRTLEVLRSLGLLPGESPR